MKRIVKILMLIIATVLLLSGCSKNKTREYVELNIYAASSLKGAMAKIDEEYNKIHENIKLVINYGASGSLQKQIEQGDACDVFISAGKSQMDMLSEHGFLLGDKYEELIKNELVLIASKDSELNDIYGLTGDKIENIAIGEPNSVPAGKYASEVIYNSHLTNSLKQKLVFAKDVKEVFAWVKAGNAQAGFVYYSDILNRDDIKIVDATFEDLHSKIIYPISVIKGSKKTEEAKLFEDFLISNKGQDIFKEFGYKTIK
ncbi:MAG: molybdate ABC transporter substrate-binding protein [Romboutsia sp.]